MISILTGRKGKVYGIIAYENETSQKPLINCLDVALTLAIIKPEE
jgi:hypothetical protein